MYFCFAEYTVDRADCVDQSFHGTFFFESDLFPVPLINIYRMDVVQVFITTDRDHICIKALAMSKAVFLQRIAFPFGKECTISAFSSWPLMSKPTGRSTPLRLSFRPEGWRYKDRSRNTEKIQLLGKCLLEKVFDSFNCNLCIMRIQIWMIPVRNLDLFHNNPPRFNVTIIARKVGIAIFTL